MNHVAARYWRGIANGNNSSPAARLLILLLILPSLLYGCILHLRACCYRLGIFATRRLPRPVISIGNLTVGGTGKTPVTELIARRLMERGLRVAVLSRGYGGSLEGRTAVVSDGRSLLSTPDQCGDEPVLLARSLPGLMVVIGADRYQAGLLACEQLNPDVFLLDDGFQHLRLQRDLNILLLDCRHPFGNGLPLPAGLMREPSVAARRADLLILTRCIEDESPAVPCLPVCRSTHRLSSFRRLADNTALDAATLAGARVAAFAGIADPAAFFCSLEQSGIRPVATLSLPDHEPYNRKTMEKLSLLAGSSRADWLLTTEKDGVKLELADTDLSARVVTAKLKIVFEDEVLLRQALDRVTKT